MVEVIAPNGVIVRASDADAERLLANGYSRPEPKPAPKRRAPRKAQKASEKK